MIAQGCNLHPSDALQGTTVLAETSGVDLVLELESVQSKCMQELTFRHWFSCSKAIVPGEPVCLRTPV